MHNLTLSCQIAYHTNISSQARSVLPLRHLRKRRAPLHDRAGARLSRWPLSCAPCASCAAFCCTTHEHATGRTQKAAALRARCPVTVAVRMHGCERAPSREPCRARFAYSATDRCLAGSSQFIAQVIEA
eukprot:IDg8579t1